MAAAVQALVKYDRLLGFACGSASSEARFEALFALAKRGDALAPRLARIEDQTERLGHHVLGARLARRASCGRSWERARSSRRSRRMNEPAPRVARVNTLKTTPRGVPRGARRGGRRGPPDDARARRASCSRDVARSFRTEAFARGDLESQDEASQLVAELVRRRRRSRSSSTRARARAARRWRSRRSWRQGEAARARRVGVASSTSCAGARGGQGRATSRRARSTCATGRSARQARGHARRACSSTRRARASAPSAATPRPGGGSSRTTCRASSRRRPRSALGRAGLVAPHGRLVYATCSFLPSEGEVGVEFFLSRATPTSAS